jgi:hypothetical protein
MGSSQSAAAERLVKAVSKRFSAERVHGQCVGIGKSSQAVWSWGPHEEVRGACISSGIAGARIWRPVRYCRNKPFATEDNFSNSRSRNGS